MSTPSQESISVKNGESNSGRFATSNENNNKGEEIAEHRIEVEEVRILFS